MLPSREPRTEPRPGHGGGGPARPVRAARAGRARRAHRRPRPRDPDRAAAAATARFFTGEASRPGARAGGAGRCGHRDPPGRDPHARARGGRGGVRRQRGGHLHRAGRGRAGRRAAGRDRQQLLDHRPAVRPADAAPGPRADRRVLAAAGDRPVRAVQTGRRGDRGDGGAPRRDGGRRAAVPAARLARRRPARRAGRAVPRPIPARASPTCGPIWTAGTRPGRAGSPRPCRWPAATRSS